MADVDGNRSGRKESERGEMGVRRRARVVGCTIGPPAESEYAVEPVGVEMMIPSLCAATSRQLGGKGVKEEGTTHNGLGEVLAVDEDVDRGQVRTVPAMERDLVHDLPFCSVDSTSRYL